MPRQRLLTSHSARHLTLCFRVTTKLTGSCRRRSKRRTSPTLRSSDSTARQRHIEAAGDKAGGGLSNRRPPDTPASTRHSSDRVVPRCPRAFRLVEKAPPALGHNSAQQTSHSTKPMPFISNVLSMANETDPLAATVHGTNPQVMAHNARRRSRRGGCRI